VFGSCTNDPVDRDQPVWRAVAAVKPDALCLIGDTPYIDSTDLAVQRAKYGNLFAVSDLAALRKRGVVVYGVWDDHDFGKNDTDGRLPGKENSRKAFIEYHPNAQAGDGGEGVYSSFRRGPVEVFLLDARWFSDNQTLRLLGERQWQWLLDGLRRSAAPYKLVTSGMVWNDSVRPDKTDYWGHYPKERQRLFDTVTRERIGGVILIGGDIHRSRAFRTHPFDAGTLSRERRYDVLPYTLHEWTSSPLGNSVHEAWNVPGPSLAWDEGNPHAFLAVRADEKGITASWIDASGRELYQQRVPVEALRPLDSTSPFPPTDAATPAVRPGNWETRHAGILTRFAPPPPHPDRHAPPPAPNAGRLVFLGDSITEGWSGAGKEQWEARFAPLGAVNAGIGGDRTQHVLWRLDHGLAQAMREAGTRLVVLMIGTNNANGGDHTGAEIAEGVAAVVQCLAVDVPECRVLVLSVFPRSANADGVRRKVLEVNKLIARLDGSMAGRVKYLNVGDRFLGEKGWEGPLSDEVMPDHLHLSAKGYTIWADAVEPTVKSMLGL
ncbi:MAG: alkaline phosphatase D family protein, partial [Phycisphaerales bacterium]|nr:alkaline phosphatase D family protein [Phycisphaerales bacterium]